MAKDDGFQAFTIRLPARMHAILKELSFYSGMSINTFIVRALGWRLKGFVRSTYKITSYPPRVQDGRFPVMPEARRDALFAEAEAIEKAMGEDVEFWRRFSEAEREDDA